MGFAIKFIFLNRLAQGVESKEFEALDPQRQTHATTPPSQASPQPQPQHGQSNLEKKPAKNIEGCKKHQHYHSSHTPLPLLHWASLEGPGAHDMGFAV